MIRSSPKYCHLPSGQQSTRPYSVGVPCKLTGELGRFGLEDERHRLHVCTFAHGDGISGTGAGGGHNGRVEAVVDSAGVPYRDWRATID